jgi:hypothetical protein
MQLGCAPRGGRGGSPVRHAQPTCCAARMKAGMPPPRTPSAKRQAQVVDRLRRALMRAPTPAEFTTSTPSDSPVARRHHAPPSCGRRPSPSSRLNSAESHVSSVGTTPATYRLMQTCIIARGQALNYRMDPRGPRPEFTSALPICPMLQAASTAFAQAVCDCSGSSPGGGCCRGSGWHRVAGPK